MEQINIYSGKKAISRIVTSADFRDLASCLEPYPNIYAIIDAKVAQKCPALKQVADVLRRRGAKMMEVEAA